MPATIKQPRLDTLERGSFVLLDFNGQYEERAMFVGIVGEGDDRHARFVTIDTLEPRPRVSGGHYYKGYYEWEAYRYNGRWAFGTSAEPLRLLEVL